MGDRMIDGPKLRAPKWWLGFALAWSRIVTGEQKRHARQARVEEGRAFQVPGMQADVSESAYRLETDSS